MTSPTQTKLEGRFNWNIPEVATSFLLGQEAETLYDSLGDYITKLGGINYNAETNTLTGSTPFLSAAYLKLSTV